MLYCAEVLLVLEIMPSGDRISPHVDLCSESNPRLIASKRAFTDGCGTTTVMCGVNTGVIREFTNPTVRARRVRDPNL